MFGEVGAVGEGLAAHVAFVRLLLLMHRRDMGSESRLYGEGLATLLALILSRFCVGGLMVLQLLLGHEAFVAAWVWARERLVPRMTVYVPHELRLVAETVLTGGLLRFIVLRAVLPETAVCAILARMVVLDMIVESFRGGKA